MNVADLDICKELYEVSGWRDDLEMWFEFGTHLGEEKKWGIGRTGEFPAYDAGFLLRKLPLNTVLGGDTDNSPDGSWYAKLTNGVVTSNDQAGNLEFADTPEDALAKLAIELFKEGILTK